jgi:hypothetical protein
MQGIPSVGLHPCGADQFDQQRMGDLHVAHEGGELVIPGPGIDGRFQNHLILRRQVLGRPVRESLQAQLAWGEDDLLSGGDRRHHDVVLVHIQRDVALNRLQGDSSYVTIVHPMKRAPWGRECVVVSCSETHTDAS